MTRTAATRLLLQVCHRLYRQGLVAATDGNVSVRLSGGNILTTRSGVNKGDSGPGDLVEVTPGGKQVRGRGKPSTELGMHLFVYRERPDISAVVHAHPPYATGFAVARIPLDRPVLPEVIVGLGGIPLARYATPSTREVADSLRPFVHTSGAVLLAGHGVVTWGADLHEAYFRMEKVEHAATIMFVARMLGGERALTGRQLDKLRAVSPASYGREIGLPRRSTRPSGRKH
jgi:L-fuculose-phosphate aldolase